jgi:pyruvate, water dikinase
MQSQFILNGLPASPGKAQGLVKIVKNSIDCSKFEAGDILVAEKTDPTMVVMMGKAAAIVTDTGGITSHASIVSREMGIPCVVATQNATTRLKDGQNVMVDGDKGTVEVYEQ